MKKKNLIINDSASCTENTSLAVSKSHIKLQGVNNTYSSNKATEEKLFERLNSSNISNTQNLVSSAQQRNRKRTSRLDRSGSKSPTISRNNNKSS